MPPVEPDWIMKGLAWFHRQFPFVGILAFMMMADVISGLIAARIERTLSSATSWKGMGKKVLMMLAVAVGTILEPFTGDMPWGKLVAVFYTVTEGLSILENLKRSGVPIPQALADAFEAYSKQRAAAEKATQQTVNISHTNSVDIHDVKTDSVVIKATEAETKSSPITH